MRHHYTVQNNICDKFFKIFSQNQGGGVQPPLIYLPQVWGGGGVATPPPPNPPTLAPLAHESISIHSFIHFLYLFMYLFICLFSYSFIHSFSMVFQSISVQIRRTCTCILQH